MILSIITVSYNTKKLLKQTLTAVFASKLDKKDYEVFVVDNNSKDGSSDMVKKGFSSVKLIKNNHNLGFAKANNQAIKKTQGQYILLLNSDTKANPHALQHLIDFMAGHPQAGIASAQLWYPDGSIQPSGGFLPRLTNVIAWMLFLDDLPIIKQIFWSYHITRQNFYKKTRRLGWVQGATMMLRKSMLDQVGLLDENIFMYGEDVDLCLRAHKQGWQVWTVAAAKVVHYQFQSSKGISKNALLGEYRGLKYVFTKHKPAWEKPLFRLLLRTGALLRMLLFGTILKDKEKYAIYQQAFNLV